jgi:hypothetical protein
MKKFTDYLENVSEARNANVDIAIDAINKITKTMFPMFGKALESIRTLDDKNNYVNFRKVEKDWMEFRSAIQQLQGSLMDVNFKLNK